MSGFLGRIKGAATSSTNADRSPAKKADVAPELTPLERMLQDAGPIRADGSDKFFGLENFGNSCYCNSIVQALYYSAPFREHVVRYPHYSPLDTPNANPVPPSIIRTANGTAGSLGKGKVMSPADAMKVRTQPNTGTTTPGAIMGIKPDDKPETPEYKKKRAMLVGPVLDLTYEGASSYGMEESTFTALKDIFMALIATQSRTGVVSPRRFLEIFKRDNEAFRTTAHQDAHEFYGIVLNSVISNVEEDAKRLRGLEYNKQDNELSQSTLNAVKNAASATGLPSGARTPSTAWVLDIFEGLLTSETRCLTCETASQRDETFLDLSIDLEEHSSVSSCLRKFSAEEMLCERNKFHCDTCGGLQEAEKRMKIKKLPKILALHLKRFKYTEDMSRLQKLFHRVVYPYHLRMFNTTDDAEDPDRLYELYAVVVHIGTNALHGHYVSIIKTQDRGWLLFDDEMVEPVDKNYVRNFFGDRPGQACAYVLFYQETTLEAVQREQEAEGLAEVVSMQEEARFEYGNGKINGLSKNGTVPSTPNEPDTEPLASLDHAVSAPLASSAVDFATQPLKHFPSANILGDLPTPRPSDSSKPRILRTKKSGKLDRDKDKDKEKEKVEKKEAKEAKKEAQVAEKERIKAEEKKRKENAAAAIKLRQTERKEYEAILAASKASAAEDEDKRNRESSMNGDGATTNGSSSEKNGTTNGTEGKKSGGIWSGLSRSRKGSKSMSRRSFGFLTKKDKDGGGMNETGGNPPIPGVTAGFTGSGRSRSGSLAYGYPYESRNGSGERNRASGSGSERGGPSTVNGNGNGNGTNNGDKSGSPASSRSGRKTTNTDSPLNGNGGPSLPPVPAASSPSSPSPLLPLPLPLPLPPQKEPRFNFGIRRKKSMPGL